MKDVLLICNSFFGYEESIVNEIKSQNYTCKYFNSSLKISLKDRFLKKINKKYYKQKVEEAFFKLLDETDKCDILLIIFSPNITEKIISKFREKFKNLEVIYYAWDSVCNFPNIKNIARVSDRSYSFDKRDCEEYGYKFLPLFCPNCEFEKGNNKYDYSMIFSIYPLKVENFLLIKKSLPEDLNGFEHIYVSKSMYYYYKFFYKKFRKINSNELSFDILKRNEVYDIFNSSKVIIDCPLSGQQGLTIRTFEALKMNKKIITTNKDIKSYEFYNSNNIYVIEHSFDKVPKKFFESEFDKSNNNIEEYTLQKFIQKLLI